MFHLFGGKRCYYASGGANDFIKSFAHLYEAEKAVKKLKFIEIDDGVLESELETYELEWWHITDSSMKVLVSSISEPYNANNGAATSCKFEPFMEG